MRFICPVCSAPLTEGERGCTCPSRHSFDKSREGYYNLLLSTGGTHGDNREMIAARRDFLNTGAYLPLAERIAQLAREHVCSGGVLLDIGCGEGYYTSRIMDALGADAAVIGFDISKDAVRLAAKRCKGATLAVASAYRMPIQDGAIDAATNLFSPLATEEISRVLRHGGRFIMAIPDENHLFGLKRALYRTPYKNEVKDSALDGFRLLSEEHISYKLTLDSREKIKSLFMMTPYAYRTPKEDRERVLSMDYLECEAAFVIFVYERI